MYNILLLSKRKVIFFSDPLTIAINILIYLYSNSVLIFSNELGKLCFTGEHLFSIEQKFQVKIYNAVVSIFKIPANNEDLLSFKFAGKRRWTPKKNPTLKIANIERIFKLRCLYLTYGQLDLLGTSILLKRIRKNARTCIVCM